MALLRSKVQCVTVSVPDEVSSMPPPTPAPAVPPIATFWVDLAIAEVEGSAALEQDTAPRGRPAIGDGQPGDAHAGAAADVKDPAGVVAADGQVVRSGAVDGHACAIRSGPLVSVMLWTEWANSMVEPLGAVERMARNEPAPLSSGLVTIKVLGNLLSSSDSSRSRTVRREWAALALSAP